MLITVLIILYAIFIILFVCIFSQQAYRLFFKGEAPYLKTKNQLIEKIIDEIDFKKGKLVYDLGCGNGKVLRILAKKRKIKTVGYEYNSIPFLAGKIVNFFSADKIQIYFQDFFKVGLSKADYVFCYLITDEMEKLEEKLNKELKSGAIVISNTFKFKDWQPEKVIVIDETKGKGVLSNRLYIYRKTK